MAKKSFPAKKPGGKKPAPVTPGQKTGPGYMGC